MTPTRPASRAIRRRSAAAGEHAAAGDRVAVDRGDHRLGAEEHAAGNARSSRGMNSRTYVRAAIEQANQIDAGGEHAPGAGDNHRAGHRTPPIRRNRRTISPHSSMSSALALPWASVRTAMDLDLLFLDHGIAPDGTPAMRQGFGRKRGPGDRTAVRRSACATAIVRTTNAMPGGCERQRDRNLLETQREDAQHGLERHGHGEDCARPTTTGLRRRAAGGIDRMEHGREGPQTGRCHAVDRTARSGGFSNRLRHHGWSGNSASRPAPGWGSRRSAARCCRPIPHRGPQPARRDQCANSTRASSAGGRRCAAAAARPWRRRRGRETWRAVHTIAA